MTTFSRVSALALFAAALACTQVKPAPPPPDAPRIESFTASKTRIAAGETLTLAFTTSGASRVEVTDDGGNAVQLEGTVASGTATVAPARSTFYVLRATGAGGRDTAFVQVAVNEPVTDVFLIAVPPVIEAGGEAQLLWGARNAVSATLTPGMGTAQTLSGSTGVVSITPARGERYTLTVTGEPGTATQTAVTDVQVLPVLRDAALAAADGVQAGKTLRFTWRTGGADAVEVSEATFGPLTRVTDSSDVANGTFDYVLPATLPTGVAVGDGLPLRFTVSATLGAELRSRTFDVVVGAPPTITRLTAPAAVTQGSSFTVAWRTQSATQVTLSSDGQPLFQTRETEQSRVASGSVVLPAPAAQTEYTLTATDGRGAKATRTFTVKPVALPVINTFTLTAQLNAAGDSATATWTTANAERVELRFENGPQLAVVTTPAQVASGSTMQAFATSARVTLEAYNAAGAVVRETRGVKVIGPAASVSPAPVLRASAYDVNWSLAALGVNEVVGLPTPPPAPVQASTRFIDLSTTMGAAELAFDDTNEGVEQLPEFPGFAFPLAGTVRPTLFVGANGFISFAKPSTGLTTNSDLSTSTPPAMLAPFWDDLTIAPTSKVYYAQQVDTFTSERMLVVQWNKVQIVGDPASELTFQAQLFETGQVSFIYGTMTGTLTSATVGIKDTVAPAFFQSFLFNGAPTGNAVVTGLELNYLSGAPVAGSVRLGSATDRRVNFVARTGSSRLAVSAEVRTIAANEVRVTEVMPLPVASISATGQWVELFNTRDASVDFGGLLLTSSGSQATDGGFVIPPETVLAPGGYLVLGQSTVPADTGGAPVAMVATDVPLAVPDLARVSVFLVDGGTSALNTFAWDSGVIGESVQNSVGVPGSVLVASGASYPCTGRMVTFGSLGSVGTPGAANEACPAPYVLSSIDAGFVPAPTTATLITLSGNDTGYADFTLPQGFTYYGQTVTTGTASSNGFITLGVTTTNAATGNDTTPSTSAPNGVVAPFWDDLERLTTGKVAMWRETDRTIISFEDFGVWSSSAGDNHLNFQVHLRDDAAIEFRYGAITTAATTQTARDLISGSSATVWLERQDGTIAVPSSINTAGSIRPNTALLFTPKP